MTFSPLVNQIKISPNKHLRKDTIDTITIHCYVGQVTLERGLEGFANPSRNASCNYLIAYDGQIGGCVPEEYRSWCTGTGNAKGSNDHRAVTIEVASDNKHPYKITDEAFESLINLVADICKRNNIRMLLWKGDKSLIGQVDKQNISCHRWFQNKSCPGDYIYERLSLIAEKVNQLLGVAEAPKDNTMMMYHTVRKNESMAKIADLYGVPLYAVIKANPQYKNPSLIHIGDIINVPVDSENVPKTYTVISGDTLSGIGKKTGIDWHRIAELNNIKFPYIIRKGQVLKLK
jgi:LysM repeat protein